MKANAPLWIVSLGQGGGDAAAVGGPGAPPLLNPEGDPIIKFDAPEEGAAGPTLGYGASIEPEGPVLTMVYDDPNDGGECLITEWEPNTTYVLTLYAVNVAGRGKSSVTEPFQLNYNRAWGGNESVVEDYLGTGERWKVHIFDENTSEKELDVEVNINPYRVLIQGKGGGGGASSGCDGNGHGSGGGGGQFIMLEDFTEIEDGINTFTIGGSVTAFGQTATNGGGGGGCYGNGGDGACGGGGGTATNPGPGPFGGKAKVAGHGNGSDGSQYYPGHGGGAGQSASGNNGGRAGAGRNSTITGTERMYGSGGQGSASGSSSASHYGKGGGRGCHGCGTGPPQSGCVIVAYQIGLSTERAIRDARLVREAEARAYEQGKQDGFDEGVSYGGATTYTYMLAEQGIDEAIEILLANDEMERPPNMEQAKPKRTRKKS